MKKKFMSFLLVLAMTVSMAPSALAAEATETISSNESMTLSALEEYEEYLPEEAIEGDSKEVTWNMAIAYLLRKAGMTEAQLGSYPDDYIGMADSLGMISYDKDRDFDDGDDTITIGEFTELSEDGGLLALAEAMAAETKEPLFVNGMAQPIFPFTSGAVLDGYSNEKSDTIRYFVWVETDYDTDGDGKLDLVKALVQMPRAAAEGDYEAATIYEARPYITGCTDRAFGYGDGGELSWDPYTNKVGTNGLKYRNSADSVIDDWASAKDFVNKADASDWYYMNPFEAMMDYEDLEWYDYYLVRGFAVVECGGLGTRDSEGFESCGANIEIDAFKCVIEWLNGKEGRKAYTDKNATTEVEAYWSNGKVGMTGRSYAGTTQFGLATTGVEGLETIVPVAGISSWYEYTNSQGVATRTGTSGIAYTNTLAAYCAGRFLDSDEAEAIFDAPDKYFSSRYQSYIDAIEAYKAEAGDEYKRTDDFDTIRESYTNFLGQLQAQQLELNGDYSSADHPENDTWIIRDYTLDADNINCSALIVHGLNDYNVRPKMFEQMYDAFKVNNNEVKLLLHQDGHLTPTYPAGGYVFDIGEDTYDELLNRWFCYYLYDVNNGADDMPEVIAQDSHEVGKWNTYKSYETSKSLNFAAGEGADEETITITSDYASNGITRNNWQAKLSEGPTEVSAMYTMPVDETFTIKGKTAVSFSALTTNEPPVVSEEAEEVAVVEVEAPMGEVPRGKAEVVDHDLKMAELEDEEEMISMFAARDMSIEDRDALMVSAMLVDIAPEGEKFDVFNVSGNYLPVTTLDAGGAWMGGGLKNFDLKQHKTTEVSYKIVTRGWMDLCNPDAGWESNTASKKVTLGEEAYDYTIYLQPTVYEVEEGHTLALVLYTYEPGMANYSQNYCITIDNASVEADIPVDGDGSSTVSKKSTKKYSVSIDEDEIENGEVKVSSTRAKKGATVTLTVTPDEGYVLDELIVLNKDGEKVELADKGNGKYTFKMPRGGVEVDASFVAGSEKEDVVDTEEKVEIVLTIDNKVVLVNDDPVINDVAPVIKDGRTFLPIRVIAENLGATVTWDEPTQAVTITKGSLEIVIYIGQPYALVNGTPVELDVPAYIDSDRTFLPVRFIAENLGATVTWDDAARTVTIVPNAK